MYTQVHCVEESLNHGEREPLLLPRKPSIVFDFRKGNSQVASLFLSHPPPPPSPSRPRPHSSQLKG
ncbi:hypothetical protein FA13DRAFT_1730404 [Coprinellus micaceus]|uniref:Uncharacterized protein n=1 Tax=Coprinellus micaceus TaxID=71717 RepID=A0A4Y7TGV3_COPMI|nr:hypothetical protein FA13DRAFT_1730404 [Coprinellus micaceus]